MPRGDLSALTIIGAFGERGARDLSLEAFLGLSAMSWIFGKKKTPAGALTPCTPVL